MLSVQLSGTFGRHVTDWKYTAVSEGSGSHDSAFENQAGGRQVAGWDGRNERQIVRPGATIGDQDRRGIDRRTRARLGAVEGVTNERTCVGDAQGE